MMNIKIFYSWQSDLPNKYNRGFIEESAKKAIKKIHNTDRFELLLNLDRDTKGEAGTPDIVETIFNKIKNSHIFICDVSIINANSNERKTPNPNVLLELGYAAGIIGWANVICVYNEAISPVESLPFDLKLRRPIIYRFDESNADTAHERNQLASKIEKAIKEIDYNLTVEIKELRRIFDKESDKARHLVIAKPEYWKLLLIEELVRTKMTPIMKKYKDQEKGLIFMKKRSLDASEFFDWFTVSLETFSQFYSITDNIFNEELKGYYRNENPIEIKDTVDKLINSCQELLEWETELRSLIIPDELIEVKNTLCGSTFEGLIEINSLPDKIKTILKNLDSNDERTIVLKHIAPVSLSRAQELFADYFRNKHNQ